MSPSARDVPSVRALLLCLLGAAAMWYATKSIAPASAWATAAASASALLGAAVAGELFRLLHLPRVSGYLVFGMVSGPYLANMVTRSLARDLQIVNGLAIALIALIAGLELNYRRLEPRLGAMVRLGAITVGLMYATLTPLLWIAWPWLPIYPEASGLARVALSFLLTTIVVSFSPTVTIAVIADTRSRGPLSEMSLAIVVITDLVLIILFSLALQFVRAATLPATGGARLVAGLAWEILGSFAFGAALGGALLCYQRYVGGQTTVAVLVLCVLLAALGPPLQLEPLLAALAAGLVIENLGQTSRAALKDAVSRGALPILLIFFMAAGASLQLDAVAIVGLTALAIAVVRLLSILGSTALAVRYSGVPAAVGDKVWMALVSQAGVTLGMAILVAREFPVWGLKVQSLMVALIAIHELVGPVLFRAALSRAGEIGKMDVEAA